MGVKQLCPKSFHSDTGTSKDYMKMTTTHEWAHPCFIAVRANNSIGAKKLKRMESKFSELTIFSAVAIAHKVGTISHNNSVGLLLTSHAIN
jgi:hypothetical protein